MVCEKKKSFEYRLCLAFNGDADKLAKKFSSSVYKNYETFSKLYR